MSATGLTLLSGGVLLVVLLVAGWHARRGRRDPQTRRTPTSPPEE